MRYYLITTIIALAAAKAKAQATDQSDDLRDGKKPECVQKPAPDSVPVNCGRTDFERKANRRGLQRHRDSDGANPVFAGKKHLT